MHYVKHIELHIVLYNIHLPCLHASSDGKHNRTAWEWSCSIDWQQSIDPPVEVIYVFTVQLVPSVSSGGVTSFILGLHHLLSSRPRLSLLPPVPLIVMKRFPDAVSFIWGAAAANWDPAVLVQRLSSTITVVGMETLKKKDTDTNCSSSRNSTYIFTDFFHLAFHRLAITSVLFSFPTVCVYDDHGGICYCINKVVLSWTENTEIMLDLS